jgi:4-amino-4-deoxy-L-arabinose transferase-like glycosyltransferase
MRIEEIIQSTIHKLEVGGGARYLRAAALVVAVLALAVRFNSCAYRNFSTPEAMDSAQLARNISEGKGYTTLFIRPFSLYLIQSHNEGKMAAARTNADFDFAQIKTAHPDIANAPVYPMVLAGLMKVLPFHYPVELNKPFWSDGGRFSRYQPDFEIALFNEILLLAAVVLTFLIARKLFDAAVAWLSALLTIGCEMLWRFSVSGLSTIFLLVIFLALAWCVLKIEESARAEKPDTRRLLLWALAAGTLAGVGALTRYSFGWVIIPLVVFLIIFSGQRRVPNALAALAMFALLLTPWIVRNYSVSGTPFGTAGFAVFEGTFVSPDFRLERSVHPDLSHAFWLTPYTHKLLTNARVIVQTDLPRLGGSWATLLFLTGLLMGFRNVAAQRMRYFLLMCLGVLIVCQALGKTQLSVESPDINSENLLVLLAPLVFMFGASLFLTFLDQMNLTLPQLRYVIIMLFVGVSCLPMISALSPPKTQPVAYPPYYPPEIQQTAGWMKENELMMSDVPWAVAWYGRHQCVWITLDWQDEFNTINKNMKPVQALYLTPLTMDGKFVSEWMEGGERSWGSFLLQALNDKSVPVAFPLTKAPAGFFPERLFLSDSERWKMAR